MTERREEEALLCSKFDPSLTTTFLARLIAELLHINNFLAHQITFWQYRTFQPWKHHFTCCCLTDWKKSETRHHYWFFSHRPFGQELPLPLVLLRRWSQWQRPLPGPRLRPQQGMENCGSSQQIPLRLKPTTETFDPRLTRSLYRYKDLVPSLQF